MKNEREYDLLTMAPAASFQEAGGRKPFHFETAVPVAVRIKSSRMRRIKQSGDFFEGLYKDGPRPTTSRGGAAFFVVSILGEQAQGIPQIIRG
jgi:hypothetical protein